MSQNLQNYPSPKEVPKFTSEFRKFSKLKWKKYEKNTIFDIQFNKIKYGVHLLVLVFNFIKLTIQKYEKSQKSQNFTSSWSGNYFSTTFFKMKSSEKKTVKNQITFHYCEREIWHKQPNLKKRTLRSNFYYFTVFTPSISEKIK